MRIGFRSDKEGDPRGRARGTRHATMRRLLPIAALALVVLLVWCLQEMSGESGLRRDRYNVVLISLDGLRADHVGAYGYRRSTTPGLDRLAAGAVRFERAVSPTPASLEAHASLFTSRLPSVHEASAERNRPLPASITTLAEDLQLYGYATAAFVDGGELDPRWKLNQGFLRYEVTPRRDSEGGQSLEKFRRKIYDVNRWLAERVERGETEDPFFVFFHSRVLRPPFQALHPHNAQFDADYPMHGERQVTVEDIERLRSGESRPSPAELRHVAAQYDAEIASVDLYLEDWLQRLFEGGGFRENTVFVLVSTQGMELFEHGLLGMDEDELFDTNLVVPFLMWVPGVSGRVVADQVRLLDLVPTLYDLLEIESDQPRQGVSLVPRILGKERGDLPALSESWRRTYEVYSLSEGGYRLLHDRKLPAPVLFDTRYDPHNTLNLASEEPERVEAMKGELERMVGEAREMRGSLPAVD